MANYNNDLHIYSLELDRNKYITPHFQVKEFACNDGNNYVIVNKDLIYTLEKLFTVLNAKAINITSGYRTDAYSKKIGGKGANDNHALGCAIDFWVKRQDGSRYSSEIIKNTLVNIGHKGGIGIINNTCVHIDSGIRARNPYIFKE